MAFVGESEEHRRVLAALRERGLVRGDCSIYGRPVGVRIEVGREPQALMDASTLQKRLVECAYATPPTGESACAAWVEAVFVRLGYGFVAGHAWELCQGYCHLTNTADLKVGMVVAVERHPYGADGLTYGHVGLYVGDGFVMDCVADAVRRVPLDAWLENYGVASEPRWGWLGSMALDL